MAVRVVEGGSPMVVASNHGDHDGVTETGNVDEEHGMDNAQTHAAGAPTPPEEAARTLTRSRHNRMVAGVAGGLGEHFNVDPVLFRLLFVILTIAGGAGLLVYAAAWLLIPERGAQQSVGEDALRRTSMRPSWAGILLLAIGVVLLFGPVFDEGYAVVWAVALIVAGVLLYRSEATPPPAPGSGPAAPPPPTSSYAASLGHAARQSAPRPPASSLGRYTLAIALLVVGAAAMLDNLDAVALDPGQYPALALTVIGAGLIVGAWWGRSRMLIVAGLLAVPPALAGTMVETPFAGGSGDREYVPLHATEVRDRYQLGAGHMIVDLTRLRWPDEPVVVNATLAFGRIEVLVPRGVSAEFDGRIGVGQLTLMNEHKGGFGVKMDGSTENRATADAHVVVDAEASVGHISVDRVQVPMFEEES